MKLSCRAFAILIFGVLATSVFAADEAASKDKPSFSEVLKAGIVDMPITTAPASFMLGSSGENVPRLSSFRAFSTQAARAFDAKGNLANSVAAEIAPALANGTVSWDDIVTSSLTRIWARTTFSFATKAGASSSSGKSAIGIQAILYAPAMDAAIKYAAAEACQSARTKLSAEPPPLEPNSAAAEAAAAAFNKATAEAVSKCQSDIDGILTKWNQPMLALGLGRSFVSASQDSSAPPEKDSTAFWLTGAYGADLGDKSVPLPERAGYLVTGHVRQTSNVLTASTASVDVFARQRILGINARYGSAKFAWLAEYSKTSYSASDNSIADRVRSVIGLEYQLGKDLYLTLGTARDTGVSPAKQSLLAKFNWGFGSSQSLKFR